jgi:Fe-S cluster biogenesis protein NfuA
MTDEQVIEKIKLELDKIKPFLMSEGGDINFVKYEDNIVYVKFSGACVNCGLIDYTLKDGVEQILMNEIPEIKEVRKVD